MLHRALIKTHHISSLAKIRSITKASEKLSCAVVMKVGRFPGIMVAECRSESESEGRENLRLWVAGVKVRGDFVTLLSSLRHLFYFENEDSGGS